MTVVLLLLVLTVSTVVVRISAFMLELTGLPWDHAKFQALSAFTNTGFTSREAEAVMQHPVRRRIVSWLIVLGNAGIVTTVGTFAGTMLQEDRMTSLRNVGIILLGVAVLLLLSRWRGLMEMMRRRIEGWLSRRYDFQAPRAEELLRLGEGYQLTRIELSERSPVVNKELRELDLPSWMVQVLAIERGSEFKPVPRGNDRIMVGDALVVYGKEDAVQKVFKPRRSTLLTVSGPSGSEISSQAGPSSRDV